MKKSESYPKLSSVSFGNPTRSSDGFHINEKPKDKHDAGALLGLLAQISHQFNQMVNGERHATTDKATQTGE